MGDNEMHAVDTVTSDMNKLPVYLRDTARAKSTVLYHVEILIKINNDFTSS